MPEGAPLEEARRFLSLMTEAPAPALNELIQSLDELAASVHRTPEGDPSESGLAPPDRDWKSTYAAMGSRFPSLGYYETIDPLGDPAGELVTGDAIDDLADIVGDLEEVVWRYETLGADDAYWHLLIHWGQHLRDLSRYLHALARREDADAQTPA